MNAAHVKEDLFKLNVCVVFDFKLTTQLHVSTWEHAFLLLTISLNQLNHFTSAFNCKDIPQIDDNYCVPMRQLFQKISNNRQDMINTCSNLVTLMEANIAHISARQLKEHQSRSIIDE